MRAVESRSDLEKIMKIKNTATARVVSGGFWCSLCEEFSLRGVSFPLLRKPFGLKLAHFVGPTRLAKLCSFSLRDLAQACGFIWKNNFQCFFLS
jgi:hypothetical protein